MKKITSILLLLLLYSVSYSQTNKRGTIKVKKSNCIDLYLRFSQTLKDTLTISQVNEQIGFIASPKLHCSGHHSFRIESYDMSINGSPPVHYTVFPYIYLIFKKIKTQGRIVVTNCIVTIITPDELDKTVFIPPQTFYIVADK